MGLYPFLAALIMFALFLVVRKVTHTGMLSGLLFDIFLAMLTLSVFALAVQYERSRLVVWLLMIAAGAAIILTLFGIYILLFFLIWNTASIFKKEKRTLSHSLTLILAAAIIIFMVITSIIGSADPPHWVRSIWTGILSVTSFFILYAFVFLTTLLLGNLSRPPLDQDYIIVLGSGLINGEVTPLLAGRIDAAMRFAEKQHKKKGTRPVLVMSGGQGCDEPRAEAVAMRAYALEKGYGENGVLTEQRSTNTMENMQFSKKVIEKHSGCKKKVRAIYATSSYHIFRAGRYAKKAGLPMDGIGAKTAFYYLPNAAIREYIAYIAMCKWRYIVISVAIFLPAIGMNFLIPLLLENLA